MKYLVITLCFVCYSGTYAVGQSFENKKMLTTTLKGLSYSYSDVNSITVPPSINSSSFNFYFQPQVTYGKVNSKNELLAYGLDLGIGSNLIKSSGGQTFRSFGFNVAPMMLFQKFIPIYDLFYLSPAITIIGGYHQSKSSNSQNTQTISEQGFYSSVAFIPLSITYALGSRTNLVFSLGEIGLSYSISSKFNESPVMDTSSLNSSLSYVRSISRLSLGYQILF